MSITPRLFATVAILCLLSACSAEGSGNTDDGTIGVLQCDEYLTKVAACIDRQVPEAKRAELRASVEQSRLGWKAATTASTRDRDALPTACSIAHDQAKEEFAPFGCTL